MLSENDYEIPRLEYVELSQEDIVVTSSCPNDTFCLLDGHFCELDWDF